MSEQAPDGVYVYQPHAVTRADGLLWNVSGLPTGMSREHATQIAEACNRILSADPAVAIPPADRTPPGGEPKAWCLDCRVMYHEFGLDLLLPRWQWLLIHPADGGLLCARCIARRAAKIADAVAIHATIGIAPKE